MLGWQQRADRQSTIADVAFNQPGNPEIERRGATLLCAARTGEILRIEPCDRDPGSRPHPVQNVPPQVQPSNQTLNHQGGHAAPFTSPSSYKLCASHGDDLRSQPDGRRPRRKEMAQRRSYVRTCMTLFACTG